MLSRLDESQLRLSGVKDTQIAILRQDLQKALSDCEQARVRSSHILLEQPPLIAGACFGSTLICADCK